jgi:hypothetical protein
MSRWPHQRAPCYAGGSGNTVDNPFGPLPIVRHWKPGDTREVLARELERLQGTSAYDSYEKTYRLDGVNWQIEAQISRADGETILILRCVSG